MNKYLLSDFIQRLVDDADEAHLIKDNEFQNGRALAFYEVLSSLRHVLEMHYPDDLSDLGIDFDVDKRYLGGGLDNKELR